MNENNSVDVLSDGYLEQKIRDMSISNIGELFVLKKLDICPEKVDSFEVDSQYILDIIFNKISLPVIKYTFRGSKERGYENYFYNFEHSSTCDEYFLLNVCKFYKEYCIMDFGAQKEDDTLDKYFENVPQEEIAIAYKNASKEERLKFVRRFFNYKFMLLNETTPDTKFYGFLQK
jgi:hypothetical protein